MEPIEQTARSATPGNDSPTHPEEMRAHIELRLGDRAVVTATARTTPADGVPRKEMIPGGHRK